MSVFATSGALHFLLLQALHKRRVAHAICVFLLVEVIYRAIPLALGASITQALQLGSSVRHALSAMIGLLAAALLSRTGQASAD